MKSKFIHYFKEIILFIVFITIFANIVSYYKAQTLNKMPLSFKEALLINNNKYTIEDGKPLLIHFWATWCPTCKLEAANIERIATTYNVITIAVKSGSNSEIQHYLNENGFTFNVVNDNHALLASEFNINAFPTTFIYDKKRNLLFSEVGYTSTLGLWLRMWWSRL